MRYAMHLVVLWVGLVALVGRAQEATAEEKTFIDRNIGKLITLDPAPVTGEALEKVFGATFYMVKVSMGNSGGTTMLVAARVEDNLSDVSMPGAAADMPALKALVKPDFKLKTDADGKETPCPRPTPSAPDKSKCLPVEGANGEDWQGRVIPHH